MDTLVFSVVLLAALLHATWNGMVKKHSDKAVALAGIILGHIPFSIVAIILLPAPSLESIPYIFASIVVHIGYQWFLLKSYEIGDLTKKMTNAMTSNISDMGQMGEVILENILQDCGMTKNRDYKTQYTDYNEEGQKFRPDVVVFLPENRNIIIDSKVSLVSYVKYYNSEDEEEKKIYLKDHLKSINTHITTLSNKNYQALDINQPDYILMFMANEPAFKLAVLEEESLYNKKPIRLFQLEIQALE